MTWRQVQGPPGDPNEIIERSVTAPSGDEDDLTLRIKLTIYRCVYNTPPRQWRAHATIGSLEVFRFHAATKDLAKEGAETRLRTLLTTLLSALT